MVDIQLFSFVMVSFIFTYKVFISLPSLFSKKYISPYITVPISYMHQCINIYFSNNHVVTPH
jgi:hypothetical protein